MTKRENIIESRILMIGFSFGIRGVDAVDFNTDTHFLDYDIVIVDPLGALKDVVGQVQDDLLSLAPLEGPMFLNRFERSASKLLSFVNSGGFAIIFLRPMPTVQIKTRMGDVMSKSLDAFMPWGANSVRRGHGNNIEFTRQEYFSQFLQAAGGRWSYEAIFDDPPKSSRLAHVRGHPDEVVASVITNEKNGFAIMTPVWSVDGRGATQSELDLRRRRFSQAVIGLHSALRTDSPALQLPEWASGFSLPGEEQLKAEISTTSQKIEGLRKEAKDRARALDDLRLHKLLVTGFDSALENAVDRVLSDLGFEVQRGPKGRVDLTAVYGHRKFAVEVQGVKRGAKEGHARKLTIWVNEVALADGKEPKGLLVVNPYREMPLAERNGNNYWPGETIEVCKRGGHCAITGLQLLGLYLDAKDDSAKREELIDRLFDTVGLFEGYEDWSQFLDQVKD